MVFIESVINLLLLLEFQQRWWPKLYEKGCLIKHKLQQDDYFMWVRQCNWNCVPKFNYHVLCMHEGKYKLLFCCATQGQINYLALEQAWRQIYRKDSRPKTQRAFKKVTRGFAQEKITLFSLGYILLLYLIRPPTCQIENTVAFQNKSKVHWINYIWFLKHTSINIFLLVVFCILQKHTVTVRTVKETTRD